jgi:hypothetical protein
MIAVAYLLAAYNTAVVMYLLAGDKKVFGVGGVPLFVILGLIWPITLILTAIATIEVLVKKR